MAVVSVDRVEEAVAIRDERGLGVFSVDRRISIFAPL
jgi:hypothetical protein